MLINPLKRICPEDFVLVSFTSISVSSTNCFMSVSLNHTDVASKPVSPIQETFFSVNSKSHGLCACQSNEGGGVFMPVSPGKEVWSLPISLIKEVWSLFVIPMKEVWPLGLSV